MDKPVAGHHPIEVRGPIKVAVPRFFHCDVDDRASLGLDIPESRCHGVYVYHFADVWYVGKSVYMAARCVQHRHEYRHDNGKHENVAAEEVTGHCAGQCDEDIAWLTTFSGARSPRSMELNALEDDRVPDRYYRLNVELLRKGKTFFGRYHNPLLAEVILGGDSGE